MKKQSAPANGNIVKTIMSGNTTIHFCDDYVVNDQYEINRILDTLNDIGWMIFQQSINKPRKDPASV